MRLATLAIALSVAALALPRQATPCSCYERPPELAYAESSHVLRGTPTSVEIVDPGNGLLEYHYVFDVTACWKGDIEDPEHLVTLVEEAACGIELFVGVDYLVYAGRGGSVLHSGLCAIYPANSSNGQVHLDWLGPSTCPLAVEVQTWGRVKSIYR